MPGRGAAEEEGGSSHCNLAGSTCLAEVLSCANQRVAAVASKINVLKRDHRKNFMNAL